MSMKIATSAEFQKALGNARWPKPEYAFGKRTTDVWYKDRGTEVAHATMTLTRGKVVQVAYMVNTDYLEKSENNR